MVRNSEGPIITGSTPKLTKMTPLYSAIIVRLIRQFIKLFKNDRNKGQASRQVKNFQMTDQATRKSVSLSNTVSLLPSKSLRPE